MRPIQLALSLGCLALMSGGAAVAQRQPEIRVDRGTPPGASESWEPAVAVEGDRVFVAWMDYRNGDMDIYFNRSLDGGRSWLPDDVRLDVGTPPGSSWSSDPQIAVTANAIVVVWRDFRGGTFPFVSNVYANRSLDGGLTWLANDVLVSAGAPAGAVDAVQPGIAGVGDVFCAVWADSRNGSRDIYFNRSVDGGTTWMPGAVRLDTGDAPGATSSVGPSLAFSGNHVHVVWADFRNSPLSGDIYYNHSGDAGATWQAAATRVDHSNAVTLQGAGNARVAALDATAYVIWNDNPSDPWPTLVSRDVFFNRTLDGGQTWLGSDVRLNTSVAPGTVFTEHPRVAVAGGMVYAAWAHRVNPSHVAFNRSFDLGATWEPADIPVSTPPAGSSPLVDVPHLAAAGNSVLVVWGENRNPPTGAYDVYYNRSVDSGTTWLSFDRRLNVGVSAGTADAYPSSPVFAGDVPYVVWRDSRDGLEDVYLNLPFGYLPFGAGAPGTGGVVPTLRGQGVAAIGSSVDLVLDGALGGSIGVVALGLQKLSTPVFGGTLLVDPLTSAWFLLGGSQGVAGEGVFAYPFALPTSTAFLGVAVFGQGFVIDPAAVGGVSLSDGIEIWIG
ncbi:MAG TPA: hypothetical protein ENI87_00115 [bacterium]|nr:hypothetical protein [bacterium]